MTRTNPSLVLLTAIVLAIGGVAVFVATSAGGQSEGVVPVDFESSDASPISLHFAREGDGSECTATVQPTEAQGEEQNVNPLCQMLVQPPEKTGSTNPDSEQRSVQTGAREQVDAEEEGVRFTLDARPDRPDIDDIPNRIPNGAEFPFTIKAHSSSALITEFYYSTDAVCDEDVPFGVGEQQPLDFHVRYYKVNEDDLQEPSGDEFDEPFATSVATECGHTAGDISQQNADRVRIKTGLDQPLSFERGDAIVTEIVAVNPDNGSLNWEIYFEDDSLDSRTQVRTDQAIEHAIWAEDRSGTQKDTFDPSAQTSERFLIPHVALRSPFGHEAILGSSSAYDIQVRDPEGLPVDLLTDTDDSTTSLSMEQKPNLASRAGALKVFEIEHPEDREQPWHYPDDLQPGPYTIDVTADVIRDSSLTFTRSVAMGAFAFDMEPVDGESTDHLVQAGNSTTFLIEVSNLGEEADSYEISTAFEQSSTGETWSIEAIGVDSNDRVTVEAGSTELVRVRVSPPDGADQGDRGRFSLEAESLTSDTQNNLTLEAQVTDNVVRDVGGHVVRAQPIPVRVDQTTRMSAFAWNQGTAKDGMSVSVVPNSTVSETGDPDDFHAEVVQSEVTGVSPGDVARVPIDVTTEDSANEGDEFSFKLQIKSRSNPTASATIEIATNVTAERQLEVVGIDHRNDEALDSLRYSRFNRSAAGGGTCEPLGINQELDRPEECEDFHNWTYHRVAVTNAGDQAETVNLSILPSGGDNSLPGRTEAFPNNCDPILPIRLDRMQEERDIEPVAVVDGIAYEDPGSEAIVNDVDLDAGETRQVYLRVGYDGWRPWFQDADQDDECSQESFHATVLATLDNGHSKSLETEIIFPYENTGSMDEDARARLAITDTYTREDGTLAELPKRTGLDLGETTTINFTVSLQQAHEDQAEVKLPSSGTVDDLQDEGWDIRLVSLGAPIDRESPTRIIVPSASELADDRGIGHAGGVDYELGLELTPPESGPQQGERISFTVLASSLEDGSEEDALGIDTQIGKTFDFGLTSGTQHLKAHPGDQVAFSLGIDNSGATRDGYQVELESSSDAVDVSAQPEDLRISSGSQQISSVRADIGSGASQNTDVTITASVTAERGTPDDPSDDLGPKTVEYTISVQPPSTLAMEAEQEVVSVSPGGETSMDFSITNEKDTPQDVEISQIVGPPGWETSLSEDPDTRRIAGGQTVTQTVLIEAPGSIVEGSTFPFVVKAENTTEEGEFAVARSEAIAQGQTALTLEVEGNSTQVVDRGDTTQFPVLVRNPGTSPTRYQLGASFESTDWLARFIEADSDNVLTNETIRVPENEFRRVLVEVQAPNEVPRGHVENVDVSAFAMGQQSVRDEVGVQAAIHDFGVEIEVTGAQAKDAAPGDDVPFEVAITNTGNGPDEIALNFAGEETEEPLYPLTSALTDDVTPTLAAGETLENVTVEVQIPSPDPESSPVAREGGVTAVIEAESGGDLQGTSAPTATAEVTTRLVDYVINDIDDDTAFEVALDLNRDLDDGYEVFRDQDTQMIERGELNSSQSVSSSGLYVVDADDDDRAEHLVDTDDDGVGNVYFDPDRAQTFQIPYTVDVTDDAQAEHPIDVDSDGVIDVVFDPASEETRKAAHLDLSGDGRPDLLVDTDGDTRYDRFVNPHTEPPIVTDVARDGDLYKVDTDGSGTVDTHYDVQTQSVQDAESANLQTFLGDYWYVVVAFLAVVVAFGVIFYRQL